MKAWMKDHHGKRVHTQQRDKLTGRVWTPGPRTVDASRATYVTLGGSRRDYRGMKVVEKTADRLTVEDEAHRITYTAAN